MNRQEFIDKIWSSREELESTLARINDKRKGLIILHGEWSVKDLIAHLGFWEERVVSLFKILQAGKTPSSFHEDLDNVNAKALLHSRSQTLAQVVQSEKSAFKDVMDLIDAASDEELFNPRHYAWTQGQSFEEMLSDNTWGHYEEHIPEMMAWLNRIA